jgi:WD40 repeat protein
MNLGVAVSAIAASKDGKWIVSGGVDGNVAIWNTTSHRKECKSSESHRLKITALDVSPDSLRVASGSDDGTVVVWRIDSQPALRLELVSPLGHQPEDSSPVSSVKFSPAGGRIASGYIRSGHSTIRIWHGWTGDQLASFPTNGQSTRSLAWSSDGRQLFAGGPHGSIRCFDVVAQRRLAKWEDSQSDVITSLHVSNTGQFLVSASASGRTVDIWDIRDISARKHLHSYRRSDVLSAAMSPNELYLVSGGKDRKIYRRCLSKVVEMSYFFHVSIHYALELIIFIPLLSTSPLRQDRLSL